MSSSADLLTPIPGDAPAGPYLRYEPVYDQIKEARREDPDLPQGDWETSRKTADWPLVIKLCTEVLAKRSKDLQVGAWLTEAWLQHEGFGGLRRGLELLLGLIEQFWEDVHPEIDDGDAEMRAAPLEWLGGKFGVTVRLTPLTRAGFSLDDYRATRMVPTREEAESDSAKEEKRSQAIADGKTTPEEFEEAFVGTPKAWYKTLVADIDGSLETIQKLDDVDGEKFGDVAPNFIPLRDALREVRQMAAQLLARKLEIEPDPPEAVSIEPSGEEAGGSDGRAGAGAGGGAAVSLAAGPQGRDEASAWVAAAARFLRKEAPTDPGAYLMLRGFRWGELRAGGAQIDPRLLKAPRTETRTQLKTLLLDHRWAELLSAGEEVMATPFGRGWLDLQRYVLTACDGLGGDYDAVSAAIRGALRALLRDLPALLDLTLMDDSPTANAETRAWLRSAGLIAADGEEGEASGPPLTPRASEDAGDALQRRAADLVRSGQPQKAIEVLMRAASQEKSERARFMRRSEATRIMVENGLEPVAGPILQEMLEQVDRHQLEDWESGEMVALPLGLLYRCLLRMDGDPTERENLYLRVCRLDPVQAMNFSSAQSSGESGD